MTEGSPAAGGRLRSLSAALGTADLRRVDIGWAASSVGNWGFMVILSIYAFEKGGAGAVGLAAGVRLMPAALFAPAAGSFVDRHSRRDVMVWSCLARTLCLTAVAGLVALDGPFAAVLCLAALFSIVATAHRPAQAALLPLLARTPQQLTATNAVLSAVDNGGFLVGALMAGTLTAATSSEAAFAVAAVIFLAAAVALQGLPRDARPPDLEDTADGGLSREAGRGLQTLIESPQLRLVVGCFAAATIVEGATDVLIVVLALDLLDLAQTGVGYLNAAWGVGGLAGGALAAVALGRGRLALGLSAGCVLIGGALAGIGAWPTTLSALGLLGLLGVGFSFVEIAQTTLLQRLVPDEVLGRAVGVVESVYVGATAIGALLAPPLVAALGLDVALIALGAGLALVAVCLAPALARFEAAVPIGEEEFGLLRGVPFLAPLAVATVENLAQRVEHLSIEKGQTVIQQGDHGDRFYVIAEGEVEVRVDGQRHALEDRGDFFGEIALLHDVARTATVVSTRPGRLLALDREHFLAAVTGQPRSTEAARAVVRERWDGAG